jgi:hypothetical protein
VHARACALLPIADRRVYSNRRIRIDGSHELRYSSPDNVRAVYFRDASRLACEIEARRFEFRIAVAQWRSKSGY